MSTTPSNRTYTVEKMAEAFGTTKSQADDMLEVFVKILKDQVTDTGEVLLPGFGRLKSVSRPARTGRNPRTGETIQIDAKTVVKFKQF